MDIGILRDWQRQLAPKLGAVRGVNGISITKSGKALEIRVTEESEGIKNSIFDVMEKSNADNIPFTLKVTGRVVKLRDKQMV